MLKTILAVDLRLPALREGALYRDADALAPGVIHRQANSPSGAVFAAAMQADPGVVRRARADAATGELMRQPVTLDAALAGHAEEQVSGTISIKWETDTAGAVRKRTKVTKLDIIRPDGVAEHRSATETIKRCTASRRVR